MHTLVYEYDARCFLAPGLWTETFSVGIAGASLGAVPVLLPAPRPQANAARPSERFSRNVSSPINPGPVVGLLNFSRQLFSLDFSVF